VANTYSALFDQSASQGALRSLASLPNTIMTYEMWLRINSFQATTMVPFGKTGSFGITPYWLGISGTAGTAGRIYAGAKNPSNQESTNRWDTPILQLHRWYHIAVKYDLSEATATEKELVLDGANLGNGTVDAGANVTAFATGTGNMGIGQAAAGFYFDGYIDEVRVWNEWRSDANLQAHMFEELAGSESNLFQYWPLNNDWNDYGPNSHHLTPYNSPVFSTEIPDWTIASVRAAEESPVRGGIPFAL